MLRKEETNLTDTTGSTRYRHLALCLILTTVTTVFTIIHGEAELLEYIFKDFGDVRHALGIPG